jgi:hypothetical protein
VVAQERTIAQLLVGRSGHGPILHTQAGSPDHDTRATT